MIYDIFINCSWVVTRWQYTFTHKQYVEQRKYQPKNKYEGRVRALPRLCEFYPGICLTTEEKASKNLCQGKKNLSQSTVYILPKHPHITKPSHTHIRKPIHTHTHTHMV